MGAEVLRLNWLELLFDVLLVYLINKTVRLINLALTHFAVHRIVVFRFPTFFRTIINLRLYIVKFVKMV